jgi:hypothetical protein
MMLIPPPLLSSLHSLSSPHFLLPARFLPPCGGPRTYPGGVSKWHWKRMQAKKARQLLKARLARESQLYEMRKRAELHDAVTHLEHPDAAPSGRSSPRTQSTVSSPAHSAAMRAS